MKINKSILVVCFILMAFMLIAAAPMQEGEPVDGNAFDLLKPVGEWASKIISLVVGLAIFLFGTIQGTQLVKILLPKLTNAKWQEIRRYVVRGISIAVAVLAVVGADLDVFSMFDSLDATFGVDPIFAQLLSGLALSLGANVVYDKFVDPDPKKLTG